MTETELQKGILAKVILDQRLLPPQVEDKQLPPVDVQQKTTWPLHRRSEHQFGEKSEEIIIQYSDKTNDNLNLRLNAKK